MLIRRLAIVLFALVLYVPTAFAVPVALPSRVESVTVFPNGAAIRRTGTTRTEAGVHQLVFGPLPVELSDATIRIGGFGPEVTAQSVSVRVAQRSELLAPRLAALEAQLATTTRRRAALAERRPALARPAAPGNRAAATPRTSQAALTDLDRQLGELDRQIAEQTAAVVRVRQEGQQQIKFVTVDVDAARAGEMSLSIEYMVPGAAAWRPTYAARLDPATGRIGLDLFASVEQRTGEDWSDVGVSLSTIVPASGLELPSLDEWQLALVQQDVDAEPALGRAPRRAAERPMAGLGDALAQLVPAPEPPAPIREQAGVAEVNLLAASIEIPGRISIGAGAPERRILASHSDFQAALEHHAAPRQSSSVYLAARFRNAGTVPLLAGPAALFVGTDYVGTTSIAQTATEDELVLPFGVDTGVTIDRTLAGRDTAQVGGRLRSTVRFGFRLNNRRDHAVDVIVLDQLPVSLSAGLSVAVVPGSRAAEPRVEGDPQGLVRWRVHADAHATDRWTFGYAVTAPRGSQIDGERE